MENIPRTLKGIRIDLGLSLDVASTRIGISKDTLANYERGDTYPDLPIIKRMEEVYGVPLLTDKVNFLLNDTEINGKNEKEEV